MLILFLALDVTVLAGWLWKGPALLSPLLPKLLALYLPNVHQALTFDAIQIDHKGQITIHAAHIAIHSPISISIEVPTLKASLSLLTLQKLKPVFNQLDLDSVHLHTHSEFPHTNPFDFADTLLQKWLELPERHAFHHPHIQIHKAQISHQKNILADIHSITGHWKDTHPEWKAQWQWSGNIRLERHSLHVSKMSLEIQKKDSKPFQLTSFYSPKISLYLPKRTPLAWRSDSLIHLASQMYDFSIFERLQAPSLQIDTLQIQPFQSKKASQLSVFATPQPHPKPWTLQGHFQGQLGHETIGADSFHVQIRFPQTKGRAHFDSIFIDTLRITHTPKKAPIQQFNDLGKQLQHLPNHPLWAFLDRSAFSIHSLHYQINTKSYVQAQQIHGQKSSDSLHIHTQRFHAILNHEGLQGNQIHFSITQPANTPLSPHLQLHQLDSITLQVTSQRLAKGPMSPLKDLAQGNQNPLWSILHGNRITIPHAQIQADKLMSWRFANLHLDLKVPHPDSAYFTFHYQQFQMQDSLLIKGWLLPSLRKLSKNSPHAPHFEPLLDSLHFQQGKIAFQWHPMSFEAQWESGKNQQTQGKYHIQATLNLKDKKPQLRGHIAWQGISLAQTFPLLFEQAFSQGIRIAGTLYGQGNYQVPLKKSNQLDAIQFQGSASLSHARFQGLPLQKLSLVKNKAPLFAGPLAFSEIRLEGIKTTPQGLHAQHVTGQGDLLHFTGWLNARFDGSFYLHTLAQIPAGTAQKLPTLTRNGMEQTPDGGRQAKLVIYGTPTRQELSNQGKLMSRAVLNNLKNGFGLF